jgi:hypothetical protein
MEVRKPRFLAAQIAASCGDLVAASDEMAPLWRAKGYERVPDMWQPSWSELVDAWRAVGHVPYLCSPLVRLAACISPLATATAAALRQTKD